MVIVDRFMVMVVALDIMKVLRMTVQVMDWVIFNLIPLLFFFELTLYIELFFAYFIY
jgi:hypothetical protein